MKFDIIKMYTVIILLTLTYPSSSYAQSDSDLSLSLQIRYNQIGLIDPLRFQTIIMNRGNSDLNDLAPWPVRGYMLIEYRIPGITDWKLLEIPYLNRHSMEMTIGGGPAPFTLLAGEAKTFELAALYDSSLSYQKNRICYYFDKYGEYIIRAKYEPRKGEMIFSNEAAFRVVPYKGPDAAAYEWLKNKRVPHFMYELSVIHDSPNIYTDKHALELIEKFPESKFATWAKLYLGRCYAYGFCYNKERKKIYAPDRAAELALELSKSEDPGIQKGIDEIFKRINKERPPEKQMKRVPCYKPSDLSLSLSLRVITDKIGLIDAPRFQAVIRNTGSSDLNLLSPWTDHRYMSVEYRGHGDSEWKALNVPYLNRQWPEDRNFPLNIRAGETKTADLAVLRDLMSRYRKGRVLRISKYGKYKVRAKYEPRHGELVFSKEAAFRVVPYEGPDEAAYEWLRQKSDPRFIYNMSLLRDYTAFRGCRNRDASELAERFPESRFAPWAKLYLAMCHLHGRCPDRSMPDYDKAARLAQDLSDSEDPDIQKGGNEILTEIKRARSSEKGLNRK